MKYITSIEIDNFIFDIYRSDNFLNDDFCIVMQGDPYLVMYRGPDLLEGVYDKKHVALERAYLDKYDTYYKKAAFRFKELEIFS